MSCHKCICRHLAVAKAKLVISLNCGMANFRLSQANGYERISKRIVLFYLNYASKRGRDKNQAGERQTEAQTDRETE